MPKKVAYLVRREINGAMATVIAQSVRGAMVQYLAENGSAIELGEEFRVKEREGNDDWTWYRRTPTGLRTFQPKGRN